MVALSHELSPLSILRDIAATFSRINYAAKSLHSQDKLRMLLKHKKAVLDAIAKWDTEKGLKRPDHAVIRPDSFTLEIMPRLDGSVFVFLSGAVPMDEPGPLGTLLYLSEEMSSLGEALCMSKEIIAEAWPTP